MDQPTFCDLEYHDQKRKTRREALPYAPDAWYDAASVKVGYEISFTRHFYKAQPVLRPLEEIRADILALERETEGLLSGIIGSGKRG